MPPSLALRMRPCLTLLLLLSLLAPAAARLYSNYLTVHAFRRNSGWNYLDRFTLDPGVMELDLTVSISAKDFRAGAEYRLELVAVPSGLWEKEAEAKCDRGRFSPEETA